MHICVAIYFVCRNTKTADSFQCVLNMPMRFAWLSLLFPFRSYPLAYTNTCHEMCALSLFIDASKQSDYHNLRFGLRLCVYFCSIWSEQRNKNRTNLQIWMKKTHLIAYNMLCSISLKRILDAYFSLNWRF